MKKVKSRSSILASQSSKLITAFCIVVIIIFLGSLYFSKYRQTDYYSSSSDISDSYEYTNDILNYSVTIPNKFLTNERNGVNVSFSKDEEDIKVSWNCTNFNTVSEFLEESDRLNNRQFNGTQELTEINGYQVAIRTESHGKTYYIYPPEGCVFFLYTDFPSLYSDLDQIARSFKYLGD